MSTSGSEDKALPRQYAVAVNHQVCGRAEFACSSTPARDAASRRSRKTLRHNARPPVTVAVFNAERQRQAVYPSLPLVALLVVLSFTAIGAQANPEPVRLRHECRLAAQVIRTGQPVPKLGSAWQTLPACPLEAGPTAAGALERLRAATDTIDFMPVRTVGLAVRDSALFQAALDVSADRGASTIAREASLMILVQQLVDGRAVTYAGLAAADTVSGCPLGWLDDAGRPSSGTPLPADARARAGAAASAIASDAEAPVVVRIAAACVTTALRQSAP